MPSKKFKRRMSVKIYRQVTVVVKPGDRLHGFRPGDFRGVRLPHIGERL